MKKLFFFLAAMVLSIAAQAAVVECSPGTNNLSWYITQGDTLVLADGEYVENYTFEFSKPGLCVKAAEGAKPVIKPTTKDTYFGVTATTTFDGITFDGGNEAQYILGVEGAEVGTLTVTNCEFKNWTCWAISNQYKEAASIDSVIIDNCLFHDGAEAAISFSEKAPEGKHSVQYFKLTNSTFYNIKSTKYRAIIQVNSNGEATGLQNEIVIDHITLANYDSGDLGAISARKSSNLKISNSIIYSPVAGESAFYIYGGTVDNTLYFNGTAKSGPTYTNCLTVDPMFVSATNGNFALDEDSPALGKATDGSNLGDPRWNAPAEEEKPEGISYELNDGELPAPAVPTNAELWGTDTADVNGFMHYFNHYYDVKRATATIANVATFWTGGIDADAKIMTSDDSKYKWLGNYVLAVAAEQGVTVNSELMWRFSLNTFFNAEKRTTYPSNVPDFTEAGKPENWGPYYQAAHEVVLPTEPVTEDYVLPTPVKEGYTFVGWYDNAEGTGEAYTVIPAGWAGTLYAIWKQSPATALDNIAIEGKVVKTIINGQLIIIKNGVQYNALGQVIK